MTVEDTGPGKDRRRFTRVPFSSPVIVVTEEEVTTRAVRDLGGGGVFVLAERAPEIGSPVRVELLVGRDRPFMLRGTVVRHETTAAHGFAVAFDEPEETRAAVARALSDLGR